MNTLALTPDSTGAQPPKTQATDVDATNFMAEVMDASADRIVIVDFWAPWCGPCKQLAPALEKTVAQTKGAAKLVKINIDTSPEIAQQLRVQSIPAVFAFFNKKLLDGFMGALPESQINAWLGELIKATGVKPQTDGTDDFTGALKQAASFVEAGDIATAHAIYADILGEQRDNVEAFAGLLRCLIALGDHETAMDILAKAPASMADHKALASIRTALELAAQAKDTSGDGAALHARLVANENDHQARFDLALAAYGANKPEEALTHLLEIVRRDRQWNEQAARVQLVKIFEALGGDHPLTVEARKQLSTILFS